jgi:RNA polymerase sigma-70 factor, ECF subfamily
MSSTLLSVISAEIRMSSIQTALQNEPFVQRAESTTADGAVRAERTDNRLVDLILAGEPYAFEQLFDRHKRVVAVTASRYFSRPEEVEEIVQVAFAKAYTELANFKGKYDRSLSSWLVRITCNACFDILRSQKRKPERLHCDLSEHEADTLLRISSVDDGLAENTVINRDLASKLLKTLRQEERALLQMLYVDEMSVSDVADAFGWSRSKVKIKAWRARHALRKVLGRYV